MTTEEGDESHTLTPAAQPAQGAQKLPTELLYHIIRLAASTDYKTAHACAYVSKAICRWTSADRWRTIICTSARQVKALWLLLEIDLSRPPELSGGDAEVFVSLPSLHPGLFVQNLFIDTQQSPTDEADVEVTLDSLRNPPDTLAPANGGQYSCRPIFDLLRHFRYVDYLSLGPVERPIFLLHALSPAKVLYASNGETDLYNFCEAIRIIDPKGVARQFWYTDHTGQWRCATEGFRRRLKSLHIISIDPRSELTGVPMPFAALGTLRSGSIASNERGDDLDALIPSLATSQPPGHPPRLSQREKEEVSRHTRYHWNRRAATFYDDGDYQLRSQSLAGPFDDDGNDQLRSQSLSDDAYARITPASWTESAEGITKLRYDTRKFSFRPCEITASRLKPFFQELTTTTASVPEAHVPHDEAGARRMTASFTHEGPRHAAPHRGAGNFSMSDWAHAWSSPAVTAKKAALGILGCGKFERIHLCWDPFPASADTLTRSEASDRVNASGAPAVASAISHRNTDADWPVERQDIWTNTSSVNNEAQAPPPHTSKSHTVTSKMQAAQSSNGAQNLDGKSKTIADPREAWVIPSATESTQSKAFRADMVDAFRTTIGWTRQDQRLLSDTPWMSNGHSSAGRLRLQKIDELVSEIASQLTETGADDSSASIPVSASFMSPVSEEEKLTVQLVPPAERLRLGGMYVPYTKAQRVRWFLDNLDTDDA